MTKLKELCPPLKLWSSWLEQWTGSKLYKFELWIELSSVSGAIINLLSSNDKWPPLKSSQLEIVEHFPLLWFFTSDRQISVSLSLCPHDGFNIDRRATTFTNLNYNQSHMLCGVVVLPTGEGGGGGRRACFLAKMPAGWEITIMIKAAAKVLVLSKSNA